MGVHPATWLDQNLLHRGYDALRTGDIELFQRRTERHRRMWCRDSLNGGIQLGERLVRCQRCNICCHAAPRVIFVYNH